VFGMALTTTAAYLIVDTAFIADREPDDYRLAAAQFAFRLYTLGLLWFGVMGAWYLVGTTDPELLQAAAARPGILALMALTALSPGVPWLLAYLQRNGVVRRLAALTGIGQFSVLGLNAISRQWLQNAEINRFVSLGQEPVNVQWSPLLLFLLLFVLGLAVVGWMVWQVVQVHRQPASRAAPSRGG
jgi:hypothetical protein